MDLDHLKVAYERLGTGDKFFTNACGFVMLMVVLSFLTKLMAHLSTKKHPQTAPPGMQSRAARRTHPRHSAYRKITR